MKNLKIILLVLLLSILNSACGKVSNDNPSIPNYAALSCDTDSGQVICDDTPIDLLYSVNEMFNGAFAWTNIVIETPIEDVSNGCANKACNEYYFQMNVLHNSGMNQYRSSIIIFASGIDENGRLELTRGRLIHSENL